MPKGKRTKKEQRERGRRGADSRAPSDDEYETPDNGSIISSLSDAPSAEGGNADSELDEIAIQEEFEDKLKDCIDGLTQKSAKGRVECLTGLKAALSKKYLEDFVTDRKLTLSDALEKCLKKGKGDEQALAAQCAVLLCLQLGLTDDTEELLTTFQPFLVVILTDNSASLKARSACATALGMMAFVGCQDLSKTMEVMLTLEKIFKASYLKGDGHAPSHAPEVVALHSAALVAWSLLLSISPTDAVQDLIDSHLSIMPELLQSADVDMRIAAGEAIALQYEVAREYDEDFEGDCMDDLCEKLKHLATDSNKYRAKKDRRQQRSSFRDVLRAVEEGEAPHTRIRFGMESVEIGSWARKRHYDSMCQVLGPGMNVHLQENELVREILGLGPPIPVGLPVTKVQKFEKPPCLKWKRMYNQAAFKALTKSRSKNRDKRAVAVHIANS